MILLILALGIGVSTAMFSAVQAVLLAPLPYPDAERVVVISTQLDETGRVEPRVSGGDAADLAESAAFGAFAYYFGGEIGVQVRGQGTFAGVTFAPPSFFDVLGVEAEAGRLYDNVDAGGSAVVSAGFAGRVFGSASGALGQTIGVEQQAIEIVGVVPAWVDYPAESKVWVAAPAIPRTADRAALRMRIVARVAEGLTAEEAREALDVTSRDLARAHPETNARRRFTMEPLATHIAGPAAATLLFLFASTGVLLLIACINVSTLTLGRIGARTREIGIRLALGASRGRVLRELWAEAFLVALAGAALAVPVAAALIHGLSVVAPSVVPRADALAINGTVLGFVAAAAALASIVCTLAPAWQISRLDVARVLAVTSGRGHVGGAAHRLRQWMAAGQIALALMLAVGAGLMGRSLTALDAVDLGFDPEGLLVVYAHAPAGTDQEYARVERELVALGPELAALPGVRAAALAMGLPAGRYSMAGAYRIEGQAEPGPGAAPAEAGYRFASPGYFETLRIPLVDGRGFGPRDALDAPRVAVVSASLGREAFGARDPIGRRLQTRLASTEWVTIVGIAGDVRQRPDAAVAPLIYFPLVQYPAYANEVQIVVRPEGEAAGLAALVREAVGRRHPQVATSAMTMSEMIGGTVARPRLRAWLAATFAALALLLAAAGVYGTISLLVRERVGEMALRLALGARPSDVARLVGRRAAWLAAIGIAAGLAGSVWLSQLITRLLFDVAPLDLPTFAIAAGALAATVLAAVAGPALRAARVDPSAALR